MGVITEGFHMTKQTVRDIDTEGKRVLVRVDYNVPIENGRVGDPLRIQASFETIKYLLSKNAKIVLMSHLGRPDGKADPKLSLAPVAKKASELLGHEVSFVDGCVGPKVKTAVEAMKPGEILLLENLRFHAEEEKNDKGFAKELSTWGEIYVDDAFATIHRAHASTVGVTEYLPSVAGFLVEKEYQHIQGSLDHPNRPLAAVIGGAKVSTKIDLLQFLIPKVDILVIGGAMANNFLVGEGYSVGKSLVEPDHAETVKKLLKEAAKEDTLVVMPDEVVVSKSFQVAKDVRTVKVGEVEADDYIVDASSSLANALVGAMDEVLDFDDRGTVVWNGPVGIAEIMAFAQGSKAMAEAIIAMGGVSVLGGGDTAGFVDDAGLHDKFTWVSTGGGASLELMSGKELPGYVALRDAK
jgi:phosphoglycerate kinase